ncbi:hypothetical protein HYH03_005536 [Edaphochlamys debaryana]|uniref:Uncharacterized protein n=1 Tax=Edaphochlamys debaryana TaxID=47281 RepID=A0A836C250_9CHLO|nr:hypothetical protein HYH03_005536 [Edaphochlamys debaryana]|eukprot:KAG2496303.1 hypothetical protein HYH03_005536 [Edaphochlamys debaryana]
MASRSRRTTKSTPAKAVGLTDVLRALSADAALSLVEHLAAAGCLPAARLTCRCLRQLVDGDVQELKLKVEWDSVPLWLEGKASLSHFTRLSTVTLELLDDKDEETGSLSSLLTLPFVKEPLATRQGIDTLTVTIWGAPSQHPAAAISGPAFLGLAALLPRLESLDLSGLSTASLECGPADLHVMYQGLSGLPCLEELALRTPSHLPGVQALANTLITLRLGVNNKFGNDNEDCDTWIDPATVQALVQLTSLRCLWLTRFALEEDEDEVDEDEPGAAGGLLGLLCHLPPALEVLCLPQCRLDVWELEGTAAVQHFEGNSYLRQGRITALELSSLSEAPVLPTLARDVLLRCSALGPRLERLHLTSVLVDGLRAGEDCEPVRALLQRCDRVEPAKELRAGPACSLEDLLWAHEALGPPSLISLYGLPAEWHSISFYLGNGPQAAQAPLPDPATVLQKAVQRLPSAQPGTAGRGAGGQGPSRVLLLHGPAAGKLARRKPANLAKGVAALSSRLADPALLRGAQALPPAAAVLLECGEAEGAAAAVERAARAEGYEVARVPRGVTPITRDVHYLRAVAQQPGQPFTSHEALAWALRPVVEEAWAAATHLSLRQRLEWALRVRKAVAGLPAFVAC